MGQSHAAPIALPNPTPASAWLRVRLWAVFLVPWIWPGCFLHIHYYRRFQLVEHGARGVAVVLAKHPDDHQSISFRYTVGTSQFNGHGSASESGLPGFAALAVGDTIPITYLPAQPESVLPGDLRDYWRDLVMNYGLFLTMVSMLTLAAGVTKRKYSRRSKVSGDFSRSV
jgi:hypothetical protein